MNEIRDGRSLTKPGRRERSRHVLRGYADLHRGLMCEWCAEEKRARAPRVRHQEEPFEELHHVLGGTAKEDADWNVVAICRWHHQHSTYGFHGSRPVWTHERAFALKLRHGYQLPPEAWGYLPAGRDNCPTPEPDQDFNRAITKARTAALR